MYKVIYSIEADDGTWSKTEHTASTLQACCDHVMAKISSFGEFENRCPNYFKQVDGVYVAITDTADINTINNSHWTA